MLTINNKNMKKSLLLLSFSICFCLNAQVEDNYRRSSLSIVLLDTDDFPNKETVINAFKSFNESDFPDKYNNFQVKEGAVFDPKQYKFSDSIQKIKDEQSKELKDDRENLKKEAAEQEKNGTGNKGVDEMAKKAYGGLSNFLNSSVLDEMNEDNDNFDKLSVYFKEIKYGNLLVEKWFVDDSSGTKVFTQRTIEDYAAWGSDIIDINEAKLKDGDDSFRKTLVDNAAIDLIPKTYVLVFNFKFFENEPVAKSIKEAAVDIANSTLEGLLKELALKAAEKVYEKTKDGYSVLAYAYLFKMEFTQEDLNKKVYEAWDEARDPGTNEPEFNGFKGDFNLKVVGGQTATTIIAFSSNNDDNGPTNEDIIKRATRRTIDNVISKLQKKYDEFKPIFPLASVNPFSAYVGLKEGINNRSRFEVFSKIIDKKTGNQVMSKVGDLRVDKKNKIWDNRFDFTDIEKSKENEGRTILKGKIKNAMPGMLVKLKK